MRIFTVDAFTNKHFCGNPAAVCLPDAELNEDVMQKVAAEMRLSETCFAVKTADNEYAIRWFTPTNEVDLCGHGTLATAHVIFNVLNEVESTDIKFVTKKGLQLKVTRNVESEDLAMSFPCYPPEEVKDPIEITSLRRLIDSILGKNPNKTNDEDIISVYWSSDTKKLFFVLSQNIDLADLDISQQDFDQWMLLGESLPYPVLGICITKKGAHLDSFEMRYFSPWNGIGEDPVNGSSHTVLGPLWKSRSIDGRSVFHSKICSKRGGDITVSVAENNLSVELKGCAVVFLSGELHL